MKPAELPRLDVFPIAAKFARSKFSFPSLLAQTAITSSASIWCESLIQEHFRFSTRVFRSFVLYPLFLASSLVNFITSAAVGKLLFLASHCRALRADDLHKMTAAACN
jgi:hypothetical protein